MYAKYTSFLNNCKRGGLCIIDDEHDCDTTSLRFLAILVNTLLSVHISAPCVNNELLEARYLDEITTETVHEQKK